MLALKTKTIKQNVQFKEIKYQSKKYANEKLNFIIHIFNLNAELQSVYIFNFFFTEQITCKYSRCVWIRTLFYFEITVEEII